MKTTLLICILAAATLWLSGCMVISEEHGHHGHPHAVCPPPHETVRVIYTPAPEPRPHPPYHHERDWR